MNRKLIALGVIPVAALAMTAGQALAGGATSKQKARPPRRRRPS